MSFGGHKIKSITAGRYGGKLITPQLRLDAFKQLDFGVDLGHLVEPQGAK